MDTDFAPASGPPAQPPRPEELPRPARRRHGGRFWLGQGARAAVGLRARLPADPLTAPWVPLLLVALQWTLAIGVERAMVAGPAQFHPPALLLGWLGIAALAWVAHALRPSTPQPPTAVQVFSLLTAQALWVHLGWGAVAAVVVQTGASARLGPNGWWALLLASWGSLAALQALALARWLPGRGRAVAGAVLVLTLVSAVSTLHEPMRLWYPPQVEADGEPRELALTPELIEQQLALLPRQAQALQAQRPRVVDLYAITFAPYGDEDVFRRESDMVAEVMADRFDTAGRALQLLNHPQTADQRPWATPENLRRAIAAAAGRMDRDEDVLFLHLTSHGAREGRLAAELWPLALPELTPQQLRQWLDEAGVRWRVISISACYAGSWIDALAAEGTLVMTAADADHTSYGCGRRSELTFFGRAVFDEQLRHHTRSFEQAHAAARPVIAQREQEAGKDDGYSNPQIRVGQGIRARLALLQARLEGHGAGRP